jgi:hypothetical protein
MSLPLLDRSNYYKGLLVLARKDRTIDPRERELMIRVGRMLDFDKRFCEAAIDDLLRNPHITDEPIVFPTQEIAECFLRDGLRLAIVDEEIHPEELAWLKTVARVNGLTTEWLDAEAKRLGEKEASPDLSCPLAIQQHL